MSNANVSGQLGTDSSLAPEGLRQAQKLAERLKDEKIDAIYCSPMKRCQQTAEPIAKILDQKPIIDDRLKEVEWGDFDGKSAEEVRVAVEKLPKDYLDTYQYDFHRFNGESYKDVEKRIYDFLSDLSSQTYKRVLVVTHGGPVRMLNYILTGEKIKYQQNGVVIRRKLSKLHLLQ